MRKIIIITLLTIFGFSSVFAQTNHVVSPIHKQKEAALKKNKQNNRLSLKSKQISFTVPSTKPNKGIKSGTLIALYDSIYQWPWDTINKTWRVEPYNKSTNYVYDANDNELSCTYQLWNGTKWVNEEQYNYIYDAYNNMTNFASLGWNGSVWVNNWKDTCTYDAENNMLSETEQDWYDTVWVYHYHSIATYDAYNNQTSEMDQIWAGSGWVNEDQSIFTYNTSNDYILYIYQNWDTTNTNWVNEEKDTLIYNASNYRTNYLSQTWDTSTISWINSSQITYTYDANNNMTGYIRQNWDTTTSSWVNSNQAILDYDANNNNTIYIYNEWSVATSSWIIVGQSTYTYDANNFQTSSTDKDYNSLGTKITDGDSTYYYFNTVVGINEIMAQGQNISVYPNPTREEIQVISNQCSVNSIEIYNLLGEKIYTLPVTDNQTPITVNITNIPTGVYVVEVKTGKGIEIKKIVKE